MFHWDTNQLLFELAQLPGVKSVVSSDPGGDYDTCRLIVSVKGVRDYNFFISGYASTEETIPNPVVADVRWVEITDGEDSRGGLNSTNKKVIRVYGELVEFFATRGAEIINHYDEIF